MVSKGYFCIPEAEILRGKPNQQDKVTNRFSNSDTVYEKSNIVYEKVSKEMKAALD